MSLHYQYLGQGLSSQKTIELLQKNCSVGDYEKIENYGIDFDELLESEKYQDLIIKTLDIIQLVKDKTLLQPIFSAVQYWITIVDNQQKYIDLFIKSVESISNDSATFKTKLVVQLFNALNGTQMSYLLFLRLLELSKQWNTLKLIITPIITNIKEFLGQWKLNQADQLKILNQISEAIDQSDNQQLLCITEYILRNVQINQEIFLSTFVKFQNINTSFLKLSEISQLSQYKTIETTKVGQLVSLILSANLEGVQSLLEKESTYFNTLNLNKEQYLNQARIAKFIQLSENRQTYNFKEISEALNIKFEEVEVWIIHAIQQQNISAQIDQLKEQIYVLDNSKKFLVKQDWQLLHNKLTGLLSKLKLVQ